MSSGTRGSKVLVLGDDDRSLVSVVRSLGRAGIEVHIGWHADDGVAHHSRYVHKIHALPPYAEADRSWKTALIELLGQERFDLVIPCSDPVAIPLQLHRKELEPYGRIYLLPDDVFQIVSDKFAMNERARAAGLRLPRERLVQSLAEVASLQAEFSLPVVLKPRSSFHLREVGTRKKVRKAYAWHDAEEYLRAMLADGPVAVQENFIGAGVGVEFLLDQGRPLMEFQHLRLHEPLQGGGSFYRKGVAVDPELREAALALLAPLKYSGVAMVEFKVNPTTGDWIFIEVNGRFWGSLPLAVASGANFPLALFEYLIQGRKSFPQQPRLGLCCRYWGGDLLWHVANWRADRSDPTLATRSLPSLVCETLGNLLTLRERSDLLTLDDPVPGVFECKDMLGSVVARGRDRLRHRWLQQRFIRRRLCRRTATALRSARKILFVCYGNICRSPFAHYLAERMLGPERTFLSAGYYPKAGRPCPAVAVEAARRWGLDLSGHRSCLLTESLLDSADAVVVFDYSNYLDVRSRFRGQRHKIYFLGALSPNQPLWIEDPYDQDDSFFGKTYERIASALRAMTTEAEGRAPRPMHVFLGPDAGEPAVAPQEVIV